MRNNGSWVRTRGSIQSQKKLKEDWVDLVFVPFSSLWGRALVIKHHISFFVHPIAILSSKVSNIY